MPVNEWYFFSCVPTGEGLIQNEKLAKILKEHNYQGFLAVEIDFLHPDYTNREVEVVQQSVRALKEIGNRLS
ncbi:MAG: sugar phosphate isomerase/epimerase [Bacteroidota bacterium]|nr:sugar phosphate isomerase/epimerase [Bacteroidota bacterium]